MKPVQEAIESGVTAAANKATLAGSAVTVVGGLTNSDIGMYIGLFIGLAGLIVNWWFQRKADRRNQIAHKAYLARLHNNPGTPFQGDEGDA